MTRKEAVDRQHFFQLSSCEYNLRGHSMKLSKQRASLDVYKFFFSQGAVKEWNLLQYLKISWMLHLWTSSRTVWTNSGKDMEVQKHGLTMQPITGQVQGPWVWHKDRQERQVISPSVHFIKRKKQQLIKSTRTAQTSAKANLVRIRSPYVQSGYGSGLRIHTGPESGSKLRIWIISII